MKRKLPVEPTIGGRAGGARPGSGNKPGSNGGHQGTISEKSRMLKLIGEKALRAGVTPLEVMLDGMRFYHKRADALMDKIENDIAELASVNRGSREHLEAVKLVLTDYMSMRSNRQQALEFAVAAAPYCHPRLAAVAVSGSVTLRQEIPLDVPLEKALELYDQNTKAFPAPVKQIEHKQEAA